MLDERSDSTPDPGTVMDRIGVPDDLGDIAPDGTRGSDIRAEMRERPCGRRRMTMDEALGEGRR